MTDLPLAYLRTLIAIADEGSHEGAAKQMSRTQSAVTQRIRRLEEIFGARLLTAVGRQRELTPAGRTLVRFGREIDALVDNAKLEVRRASGADLVRIGAPQEIAETFLVEWLSQFSAAMPNVRLDITVIQSLNLLKMLREGQLDIALSARPSPNAEGRVVMREPCYWIAAEDFRVDIAEPLPMILTAEPSMFRRIALATLEMTGTSFVERVTAQNLYGIRLAVATGMGITARTASAFIQPVQILTNVPGLPELPSVTYHAYLRDSRPSSAVAALYDIITASNADAPVNPDGLPDPDTAIGPDTQERGEQA